MAKKHMDKEWHEGVSSMASTVAGFANKHMHDLSREEQDLFRSALFNAYEVQRYLWERRPEVKAMMDDTREREKKFMAEVRANKAARKA